MFGTLLARADRTVADLLGDAVTYAPGTGASVEVLGQFDELYVKVEAGNAGMSSSGPSVCLVLSDLPSNPATDLDARVTINGTLYKAWEVEPDGKGLVRLFLNEAE